MPIRGNNPAGDYLLETDASLNPSAMAQVRNDVPQAGHLNLIHAALELVARRMIVFTLPSGLATGLQGKPCYMDYSGIIRLAAVEIDSNTNIALRLLKNGANICGSNPLTVTANDEGVDTVLTGWTKTFARGDTLQVEVLTTTTDAFCLTVTFGQTG